MQENIHVDLAISIRECEREIEGEREMQGCQLQGPLTIMEEEEID